jgi:hypothetical protein
MRNRMEGFTLFAAIVLSGVGCDPFAAGSQASEESTREVASSEPHASAPADVEEDDMDLSVEGVDGKRCIALAADGLGSWSQDSCGQDKCNSSLDCCWWQLCHNQHCTD